MDLNKIEDRKVFIKWLGFGLACLAILVVAISAIVSVI